jgi:hypothetical protein
MNRNLQEVANDNGMSRGQALLRFALFILAMMGATIAFVRWIVEG